MGSKSLLIDSSVIIAFFNLGDSLHKKAKIFFDSRKDERKNLLLHPLVFSESLSILKMKTSLQVLRDSRDALLDRESFLPIESISIFSFEGGAWGYFNAKNNLSFVDAAVLDYCLENGSELITFDKELDKIYKRQRRN